MGNYLESEYMYFSMIHVQYISVEDQDSVRNDMKIYLYPDP
jgi:hypothetical protein